ncbi:hypothetical protein R1sor_025384 [Riccia sorocarpa]|uniref:Uncharacterized protein n=1 Tax=Riccia sorocarpa TaxID=122646 RepID=A0ABD3GA19_9MARC
MALRTRNVGRKRKERSPIVEFPPEDAEVLIDLTVSKIVETAEEDESSKHNSATAASTAIEVYRPQGALQTLDDARGFVTLEELSLLERDEVYPYLDLSHLQHYKGFVNISSALFSRGTRPGIDVYTVDLSNSGLKKLVDFPAMGQCSRVVPGSVIEKHFLDQLGCDCLKNSWEEVNRETKFREGWQAVVELVTREFLARQAARLQQQSQVLQLEYSSDAKNAFPETKVVRDAERGELIAERERLRTELEETQSREEVLRQERWQAQEEAMQAEMREGALRDKHEKLQREYSTRKEEWEARNQKLVEEVDTLHLDKRRISERADNVQGELAGIRSLLEAPRSGGEDVASLKRQLQVKKEQLKRLQDADAKVMKRLRQAKKKGLTLEKELSKMPAGLMVKAKSNVLDVLRSGAKWQVSLYPPLFDCSDVTNWKKPLEFVLDREATLTVLEERMACSLDIRSLPPSEFDTDEGMSIEGIPTMRVHKKEWRYELKAAMTNKTTAFVRNIKTTQLRLSPPLHCVHGEQFRKWNRTKDGVKRADWAVLWGYPLNKYWIICIQSPRHEVNSHNQCLETVNFDVPRGELHSELLRRLNMALCIRLRPHDGIFLEFFVRSLLSLPWALDILHTLVEKEFVTVWGTGEIPISVLESKDSYKAEDVCLALKPLWSVSKVWKCDDLAHSRKETMESDSESEHKCQPPPKLPSDICLWLPFAAGSSYASSSV